MIRIAKNKKAVSNTVFAICVGALIVVCAVFGFVAFVQSPNSQAANVQLQNDYENLQADYDNIVSNYQNLQSSYTILQNEWDQIESDLNTLQSSFDQLNATYQELLEIVESGQGNIIE
ncbi:MAG: hypothetical protein JW702_05560 [Clostridiales bacterium]|nr:hypothetical protein [Clostridiales bacterium]